MTKEEKKKFLKKYEGTPFYINKFIDLMYKVGGVPQYNPKVVIGTKKGFKEVFNKTSSNNLITEDEANLLCNVGKYFGFYRKELNIFGRYNIEYVYTLTSDLTEKYIDSLN